MERPNSKAHVDRIFSLYGYSIRNPYGFLSVWDESENGRFRLSGLISEIVISFMTVFNHYLISTFDFLISYMPLINS